jgi:hypothetical protein
LCLCWERCHQNLIPSVSLVVSGTISYRDCLSSWYNIIQGLPLKLIHSPWHYTGSSEVLSLSVELVEIMLGWLAVAVLLLSKIWSMNHDSWDFLGR